MPTCDDKKTLIRIDRLSYSPQATFGVLTVGSLMCYTLEDTVRAEGIKVEEETAIPSGTYMAKITRSKRFGRDMLLIYSQDDYSINEKGVKFSGVRVHGGNTHKNTEGCVLIAHHISKDPRDSDAVDFEIYGTAEKEFMKELKRFPNDFIVQINNSQQEK